MKLEIFNGDYVGTAEWQGPGRVALAMADERERDWFAGFFAAEDSYLTGPVECAEMASERRDSSEQAFERAAFRLAAYAYTIKHGDGARHGAHTGAER